MFVIWAESCVTAATGRRHLKASIWYKAFESAILGGFCDDVLENSGTTLKGAVSMGAPRECVMIYAFCFEVFLSVYSSGMV